MIFGTGGSPIRIDEYVHARKAICLFVKKIKQKYQGTRPPKVSPVARPYQAQYFGDLRRLHDGKIWNEFCHQFLFDWVGRFLLCFHKGISNSTTNAHAIYNSLRILLLGRRWLAPRAFVLTTNFDGAIPEYVKGGKSGPFAKAKSRKQCLVIDEQDRIKLIPQHGVDEDAVGNTIPWIITLRGDVYHALCENPLCSMGNKKVSVYESLNSILTPLAQPGSWLQDNHEILNTLEAQITSERRPTVNEALKSHEVFKELNRHLEEVVDAILRCPECGGQRTLSISFPGLEIKEAEIAAVMARVWQTIGSRISTIMTIGFSGNSDREVVGHLASFADKLGCKWFHLTKPSELGSESPFITQEAVRHEGQRILGSRFKPIEYSDASSRLSEILRGACRKTTELVQLAMDSSSNAKVSVNSREIAPDGLWIRRSSGNTPVHVLSGGKTKSRVLQKNFPEIVYDAYKTIVTENALGCDLQRISQLALKDYWWNPYPDTGSDGTSGRDPIEHNRLNHSIGVMRVADLWAACLKKCRSDLLKGAKASVRTTVAAVDTEATLDMSEDSKISTSTPDFNIPWTRLRVHLLLAALMHDIGHAPFSHLIEEVFNELHWSLDGRTPYSHEQLSVVRARHVIEAACGKHIDCDWVCRLIQGASGIHWVDAILNSPFDADKIDYLFRDQWWLGMSGRQGARYGWLGDFLSAQTMSPQGQIFLNGPSAVAAFKLLSERCYLYDTVYFSPKARVMERMVRHVLCTYFTLKISDAISKAVCEHIRRRLPSKKPLAAITIGSLLRNKAFIEKIIEPGVPDQPQLHLHAIQQFLSLFSKSKQQAAGDRSLPQEDLGVVKIAYCLADLLYMTKGHFPRTTALVSKAQTEAMEPSEPDRQGQRLSDQERHPLEGFLIKYRGTAQNVPPELGILGEIGLWALERSQKDDCTHSVGQYKELADLCALLLDPEYSPHNSTKADEPSTRLDYANGRWLDRVFRKHCIAGPYVLRPPGPLDHGSVHDAEDWLDQKKAKLSEIGRQLSAEHPGRVLVDIIGPIRVRGYPRSRTMHSADGKPYICEQYWVPDGDPLSWSVTSTAAVPLYRVDFRQSIPYAYKLRVLLIDPTGQEKGRAAVIDCFRKACKDRDILLEEE